MIGDKRNALELCYRDICRDTKKSTPALVKGAETVVREVEAAAISKGFAMVYVLLEALTSGHTVRDDNGRFLSAFEQLMTCKEHFTAYIPSLLDDTASHRNMQICTALLNISIKCTQTVHSFQP